MTVRRLFGRTCGRTSGEVRDPFINPPARVDPTRPDPNPNQRSKAFVVAEKFIIIQARTARTHDLPITQPYGHRR